jgi:hypothetical protein
MSKPGSLYVGPVSAVSAREHSGRCARTMFVVRA